MPVDRDQRQFLAKPIALAFVRAEVNRLLVDERVIEAIEFLLDRFPSRPVGRLCALAFFPEPLENLVPLPAAVLLARTKLRSQVQIPGCPSRSRMNQKRPAVGIIQGRHDQH